MQKEGEKVKVDFLRFCLKVGFDVSIDKFCQIPIHTREGSDWRGMLAKIYDLKHPQKSITLQIFMQ